MRSNANLELRRARLLPLGVILLIGILAYTAAAQEIIPNGIAGVSPGSAVQGTTNLTVTFTLADGVPPPPPADVPVLAARIGTLAGHSIMRNDLIITAVFDIPWDEPPGTKDAEIDFPAPPEIGGTLTFQRTAGFTITGPGETPIPTPTWSPTPTVGPSPTAMAAGAITDVTYPIVDTGQNHCYDATTSMSPPAPGAAFYGQDAQFKGNQPSYTLSGDGLTVHDNITGLTWTRSPDLEDDGDIDVNDKLTFAEALTYADIFLNPSNFGGYSDWRLPSMKELYSLMDFRGTDPDPTATDTSQLTPFIDTDYFDYGYGDIAAGERIIDSQFWSSNIYVGLVFVDQTATFGLNLADGRIKGYPSGSEGPITKLNYVYFVRGNPDYGVNGFIDNGDGTITDNATGLMWTQNDGGVGMNWEDALAWAQARNDENYLGYSDWRLPNAKELQSIVDYTRSPDTTGSAAIDPVFNATQITNEAGQPDYPFYWTGTTHLRFNGNAGAGVYLAFGRGLGSMDGVNVIDVHGAGCQRSDPKDGDPGDYPSWGHGPQGDVQRVFNHVRLVRDAETETLPQRSSVGSSWLFYE